MSRKMINVDKKLDDDINLIQNTFKSKGFNNVSKSDVLRLLIERYKKDANSISRKRKSNTWFI